MDINKFLESFEVKHNLPIQLNETMVERGTVYKIPIISSEICEISLLQILPFSKIKKHKHTDDSEIYLFVADNTYSICKENESHDLDNNSDKCIHVLSIKTKGKIISNS